MTPVEPTLEIVYRKHHDAPCERRRLTPRELLTSNRGRRYLTAYDHDRNALRTFRVDRIEAASFLNRTLEAA